MSISREDELIYEVLSYIKEEGKAAGAGSVQRRLKTRGYSLAEASVGRLLRDMQYMGFLVKESNTGRSISPLGEEKLRSLESARWQGNWAQEFFSGSGSSDKEHLTELLIARRPVEIEVARLASENATAEEIGELRRIVDKHEHMAKTGRSVSQLDTEFHQYLAKISHNSILEAIVELLRKKEEDATELEGIRRHAGNISNDEHRKIFEAVAHHDAELAILAMKRHLNNLMHTLEEKK
ncbi:MAG: FCD domain-containing protein [Synergistes sp.]|nr:FCD domain-containing protein [Synergistes sp.]